MIDVEKSGIVIVRGSAARLADATDSDPIAAEVIRHGLNGAAERMMITLRRAAFSPLIYEAIDFACGLFDAEIRLLAQCRSIPQFLGTLSYCVEAAVAAVGGAAAIEPGDVIWSTDGYANGSHSQDAVIVVPAFFDDALVAFAAVKAHQLDIAAKHPFCTDTVDNFQEGVTFPGVRLWRRGELQTDMWRTLLANSRMPKTLAGDVQAQVAAANAGVDALHELIGRQGPAVFWPAVERVFDHGEAVMRRYVQAIPDGQYVAQAAMDSNGVTDEPVPFEIQVSVAGSDIVVDFSNSAPEQAGPINCPLATTVATARLAIMALVGGAEDLPNEGHFRPIEIRARPGTIFCPRPPAPIFLYGWTGDHATEVIHLALASALPTGVPAGSGGTLPGCSFFGTRADGTFWHDGGNIHMVGQGATHDGDASGPLTIISCSGTRNVPAEVVETRYPITVEQFELAPDFLRRRSLPRRPGN